MNKNTYAVSLRIREENFEWLEKQIKKATKTATKLGLPVPVMKVIKWEDVPEKNRWVRYAIIAIAEIPELKVDGWQFGGIVRHMENNNVVKLSPWGAVHEAKVPKDYYTDTRSCDHCQKNRRRNDTYIVYNENQDLWKRVGSNCVKDFLGHMTPSQYAKMAEYILHFENLPHGSPSDPTLIPRMEVTEFVACVVNCVHASGGQWYSSKGYRSTADSAWFMPVTPSQQETDIAAIMVAWGQNLPDSENNFMMNLRAVCLERTITQRESRLLSALYPTYQKEFPSPTSPKQSSDWVGQVGTRWEDEVTIQNIKDCNTSFGHCFLVTMHDKKSNLIKWFTPKVPQGVHAGATVVVRAKVKKQDEWNGEKQTVVNYLSVN